MLFNVVCCVIITKTTVTDHLVTKCTIDIGASNTLMKFMELVIHY